MVSFRVGKLPSDVLLRHVLGCRGRRDPSVIRGPAIGEDAALISHGRGFLVLKTDPVTGTTSDLGWFAVHVNANDIACKGGRPRWFMCELLLPVGSTTDLVKSIMSQVDEAAKGLGVSVVGGHSEITAGIDRPIVVGCMIGVARRGNLVATNRAKLGSRIVMTKSAGIEGTAILAANFADTIKRKGGRRLVDRGRGLVKLISIVKDAEAAMRVGGIEAMHDPTEAGLLQGVWELAEASKLGFCIYESSIPVYPEIKRICDILGVDPLRLMSSGCLLIAAGERRGRLILRALRRSGIQATVIGIFTPAREGRRLVRSDGSVEDIVSSERDELYRVMGGRGQLA